MPLGGKEMQRALEADKRKGALSEVNKQYLSNMQKVLDKKNIEYLCFEKDRDTVYMVVWKRDQNTFLDIQKEVYDYHFSIEHKKSNIITLYHGSDHILEIPKYGFGSVDNDYGRGFYLTDNRQKSDEWALMMGNAKNAITNAYEIDLQGLNVLNLDNYGPLAWIAEIAYNRSAETELAQIAADMLIDMYKVDTSNADIIIGYRADSIYMRVLNDFYEGKLSIDETIRLFKKGELGEQYCLKSEKAFQEIIFTNAYKCEKIDLSMSNVKARNDVSKFLEIRNQNILHGFKPQGLTFDDITANKFIFNSETQQYEVEQKGIQYD